MIGHVNPPLSARNGRVLRVLGIARISTINQDVRSLRDQEDLLRGWVAENWNQKVEFKCIATRGSGEDLQREELDGIRDLVATMTIDLIIMEDLGRYMRDLEALKFCGLCVDSGARLIALNDGIDTARDGWKNNALFAAWRHECYNEDTSRRIKQRQGNRFEREGGMILGVIYGYTKPPGVKTDDGLQKDPAAEPIYDRWFSMLEEGASFQEVADWLNANNVPVGSCCDLTRWNGCMVSRVTRNPVLKGVRVRNRMHTVKHNQTGKRRSVKCNEPRYRSCPHLVFIEAERYDRVLHMLKQRNAKFRRKTVDGRDPCASRPKRRTTWPGQHCFCGICGRALTYGAHGHLERLFCKGCKLLRCWNTSSFDGPKAAQKIAAKVLEAIEALPDFNSVFLDKVRQQLDEGGLAHRLKIAELDRKAAKLERAKENLLAALREYGPTPVVKAELDRVTAEAEDVKFARQDAKRASRAQVEIPSIEALKAMAREVFGELASDSAEFARKIKRLIPRIVVYPHRLCTGGEPELRARFTLNLARLIPGGEAVPELARSLSRELDVDLFDLPQRVKFRAEVMRQLATFPDKTQREIGAGLGITATAVQYAIALDRKMTELGLTDPYEPILQPPKDCERIKLHRHPAYCFEPLGRFEDEPDAVIEPPTDKAVSTETEAA